MSIWEELKNQPAVVAAIISLFGVLMSSLFGYISSYIGNQQSQKNELRKIRENQKKQIEQQNKLEKDKALRAVLQKLTYAFYNLDFDEHRYSTYFNTPAGHEIFNDVMSFVTAYGHESSVQCVIYLQKAIFESNLLKEHHSSLQESIDLDVDWLKYEVNALAALLIAQLRYDISKEIINPKELLSVKYNNNIKELNEFFGKGVDIFIDILHLEHFDQFKETNTEKELN